MEGRLQPVFVCAMRLTGFDAPTLSTMYFDQPMKDHTLMQAIAGANRVTSFEINGKTKRNGEIVDYYNVFRNMKKVWPINGYPFDLVGKLLYGCGSRLFECLNLRIHNFNFDAGILTVHDGKGKKDRTVPLPQSISPELTSHLERAKNPHQAGWTAGMTGCL